MVFHSYFSSKSDIFMVYVDVFVLKCAHSAMMIRDMAHNGFIGGSYISDNMSNNPPIIHKKMPIFAIRESLN